MVNITKLYCGEEQPADNLRYGHGHGAPRSAAERKPIVVWNVTRTCNLRCVHCYSDSYAQKYSGELALDQAKGVLDDLKSFVCRPSCFRAANRWCAGLDGIDRVRHR